MSFPGAQSAGSLGPLPKGWPEPISLPRPLGYRYWYRGVPATEMCECGREGAGESAQLGVFFIWIRRNPLKNPELDGRGRDAHY